MTEAIFAALPGVLTPRLSSIVGSQAGRPGCDGSPLLRTWPCRSMVSADGAWLPPKLISGAYAFLG
jgi:hypothetical protein